MNKDYKAKLLEKAGIYVDCCQLLKCVYKLLFSMPKKDRVIIGDKIIEYNLSMIAHFSKGFQFKECRLAEIDSFLFAFDRMKALLRMASELKILLPAKYVLLFDYIERIDEGVAKRRNASTATKRRMWLFVEKALSKFKNVLYWNSEKNSFSTKELKHS